VFVFASLLAYLPASCFFYLDIAEVCLMTVDTKVGCEQRRRGAKVMHFCTLEQEETTRTAMHIHFLCKNHEENKLC